MRASELHAAAGDLRAVVAGLSAATAQARGTRRELQAGVEEAAAAWTSPAATAFTASVRSSLDRSSVVDGELGRSQEQVDELQRTAAELATQLGGIEAQRRATERQLHATASRLAAAPPDDPSRARLLGEHQELTRTLSRLDSERLAHQQRWTSACQRTAQALQMATVRLQQIAEAPRSAPETGRQNGLVDNVVGYLLGDLLAYWHGDRGVVPGAVLAGANRVRRVVQEYLIPYRRQMLYQAGRLATAPARTPRIPTFANGLFGRVLGLNTPLGNGIFRGLGVVGSGASTVLGVRELVAQGNPVDAYRERGAHYLEDVASTAFSGASTAFFVAPNPVTAGAVVVTGVAWAGTAIYNRREQIGDALSTATTTVTTTARAGVRVAHQVASNATEAAAGTLRSGVDSARDTAGSVLDTGRSVVGALNPFGG